MPINLPTIYGNTALHQAARDSRFKNHAEYIDTVFQLIMYGANANQRNNDGKIPLDFVKGKQFVYII